jgi:hypothetical protein
VIEWNILPTYDPEGDSYEGPPRVTPPKKVDSDKWKDDNWFQYLLTGNPRQPELSRTLNLNLRANLYGVSGYRLQCQSLRDYSEDPRKKIVELGSGQVILAGVRP